MQFEQANAVMTTDKINHAVDSASKGGIDFKMEYLQKDGALNKSQDAVKDDKSGLPNMVIEKGIKDPSSEGEAKAHIVHGEAKESGEKIPHGMGYKPESKEQLDDLGHAEKQLSPNSAVELGKKGMESGKTNKTLEHLPSLDLLETNIKDKR